MAAIHFNIHICQDACHNAKRHMDISSSNVTASRDGFFKILANTTYQSIFGPTIDDSLLSFLILAKSRRFVSYEGCTTASNVCILGSI